MLQVENISKSYLDVNALRGVSFELNKGEILGLIGPDGAGKTTLLRIIVTLLKPNSGSIFLNDSNIIQNRTLARTQMGYMPERFSLYQDLTIQENLIFFGELFGLEPEAIHNNMEKLYAFSNLKPFYNRKAGALSGGMKQKLALSCMLMHEPKVLILDEPSTGVDPVSRHEFWKLLHLLATEGTAILVSTPYLEEAQECDRVALINNGQFMALGKPDELTQQLEAELFEITSPTITSLYEEFIAADYRNNIELFGYALHYSDLEKIGLKQIQQNIKKMKSPIESIKKISPSLEDVFLHYLKGTHE